MGDRVLWSNAALLLGWSWWESGRLREGEALVRDAYSAAIEAGDPLMIFLTTWNLGNCGVLLHDPQAALDWLMREADSPKLAQSPGSVQTLLGMVYRCRRDLGHLDQLENLRE